VKQIFSRAFIRVFRNQNVTKVPAVSSPQNRLSISRGAFQSLKIFFTVCVSTALHQGFFVEHP
jgi:hypothetical protein